MLYSDLAHWWEVVGAVGTGGGTGLNITE